jgi:hypothetical protein
MSDEADEGTAMFKMVPTAAQLPAQGTFVPLNIDGEALSSDCIATSPVKAVKCSAAKSRSRPRGRINP